MKCLVNPYVTLRCGIKVSTWTKIVKSHIEIIQNLQYLLIPSPKEHLYSENPIRFREMGSLVSWVRFYFTRVINRTNGTDLRYGEDNKVLNGVEINTYIHTHTTTQTNKTRRAKERKKKK